MGKFDEALKDLLDEKLNGNSYGVEFNVNLYNSPKRKYYREDDDGNKIRFVPTVIPDIRGEHIPIPNTNSTSNSLSLDFEIFVDKVDTLSDQEIEEFAKVGYSDTLNAIEEFKSNMLANYFPLGTPSLYLGGEDSSVEIDIQSTLEVSKIYLEIECLNNDEEDILNIDTFTYNKITKDATNINFVINALNTISIPYTVGVKQNILITLTSNTAKIEDGTNSDTKTTPITIPTVINNQVRLASTSTAVTGGEFRVSRLILASGTLQDTYDGTNIDDVLPTPQYDIKDFDNKETIVNQGSLTGITTTASNCILWGSDGSAIFGFSTLMTDTGVRSPEGFLYQVFFLDIECFVSNDLMFGNNVEYHLSTDDGVSYEQIYPADRQHTLGTELNTVQKINQDIAKSIVEETSRDVTHTFYYIPSKKLNKLLKQVVTDDVAQNETYKLKVQYPFFQKVYDVIVDSGGTSPNINSIMTFTVTYKYASDIL